MSTNSDFTMDLGVVTINNQRYMAVLHYDGPIEYLGLNDQELKKANQLALGLFQGVLSGWSSGQQVPPRLINRVSAEGVEQNQVNSVHNDASKNAWDKFVEHLELQLGLVDLTEINACNKKLYARVLFRKIDSNQEGQVFLDRNDKLFLRYKARYKYPNLIAGQFNLDELERLQDIT